MENLYRKTYYEVIDFVLHAICYRFKESLLCDAEVDLNKYDDVLALYKDDFERDHLPSQLCILHSNLPEDIEEETGGTKLKSLVRCFQTLSPVEHQFYDMVIKLTKIILTMPTTNAISERNFSVLRHMKTWLRSAMNQTKLNLCMHGSSYPQ